MIFTVAVVFFFAMYYLSVCTFSTFLKTFTNENNEFFKMSKRNIAEYHSRNVSDVHAMIALPIAFYSCFYVCDDPAKTIFNSDACLNKPHKIQIYGIVISTAYCVYDLIVCIWIIGYKMREGADFIFHHVVGIGGAVAVLFAG